MVENIKINKLQINKGQLEGLPKNPRFIRDERFKALVKSIEDAPEMLSLRELLVYPYLDSYIVIGGNMRLRACKELGYKEVPCKVLPRETPIEKLREYTIKDNNGFGQNDWDLLANEWDVAELENWGLEVSFGSDDINIDELFEDTDSVEKDKGEKITILLSDEYVDEKDKIKNLINNALADYQNIKIK